MTPDDYVRFRRSEADDSVGELFGTESFCHFLYSIVRMDRPSVLVELGCGGAATTVMVGKALRENRHGHCWTVDNGEAWKTEAIRVACQAPLGEPDEDEPYGSFVQRLLDKLELAPMVTLVEMELQAPAFYSPGAPIDLLFADATPSHVEGCLELLKYYLPRVSSFSSIFIDRAGTINHSFLVLQYIVDQLNRGKLPWHLTDGLSDDCRAALERLVQSCTFQLVNLAESKHGKRRRHQNSRAWIKIQPVDFVVHNDVENFGSITSPWPF